MLRWLVALTLACTLLFTGCGWHYADPRADCAAHRGVRAVTTTGFSNEVQYHVSCNDGEYVEDWQGER